MKRRILSILTSLLFLTGCAQPATTDEILTEAATNTTQEASWKSVIVKIRVEETFETLRTIEDAESIQALSDTLDGLDWELGVEITTDSPPHYRFMLDPERYAIWITPDGQQLEITSEMGGGYVKAPKEVSDKLYFLITGEQLSK